MRVRYGRVGMALLSLVWRGGCGEGEEKEPKYELLS